ncbi:hypothetical protein Godav_018277 [Gossypium davidsonii]|uniref:Uncharacterized protein n=1 Tax=Gossypium davidsonii TaxID=34287 RepID=A0A7J8QX98_GOSDV|nr:hypothetical protein [Gossypium davidsonii]
MSKAYDRAEWSRIRYALMEKRERDLSRQDTLDKVKGENDNRMNPSIIHLLFADDCIFFCEASDRGSYAMNGILKECEFWSSKKFGVSSIKRALFFRSGKVFRASKCDGKGFKGFRGIHIVITTVDKIDAYQCFDFSTEDCLLYHMGYLRRPPKSPLIKIKFDVAFNKQLNRLGSGIVCKNCVGEIGDYRRRRSQYHQENTKSKGRWQKEDYRETNWFTWMEEYRDRRVYSGIRQKNIIPTGVVIGNGGNGKENKGIWKIDQRDEEYNRQKGVLVSKTDVLPNGRGDDSIQWLVLDN